jgi:hypothetical protein
VIGNGNIVVFFGKCIETCMKWKRVLSKGFLLLQEYVSGNQGKVTSDEWEIFYYGSGKVSRV